MKRIKKENELKKKTLTEEEQYIVRFDRQKADSHLWEMNLKELVRIETPQSKMKNNHDAAGQVILDKYPGCKIVSVTYC